MNSSHSLRLAVDIGGTFTDTVLVKGHDSIVASTKTLTTHHNPFEGAMEGTLRIMDRVGESLADITGFIHGTTLATNALIERRGAKVATITTEGFRDILEIAYERRYSQYDINIEKPIFLVPRERSLCIKERMSVNGTVLIPLEEKTIPELVAALDQSGADAVAICLMHSYVNAAHEERLREQILAARPNLVISISSEVSPEAREFDRLCTTVANTYIQPLMQTYLLRFASEFREQGLCCPILMMTAGGGMTTIDTAARFPIRLVESGPAGGAILAARIAQCCGLDQVLSFDMGGTTAKLCLIDNARPQKSRQFEIARAARFIKGSGMPVRIPVIEMIEIGAGGGSIAGVDHLGRLTVGPESAGSEPGPVAFGRGGNEPTVTDSDITLGYIMPDTFAEGLFQIEAKAAANALTKSVGTLLHLDAVAAADGVSRIVDESMASAARMHAAESGKDLGDRTMIAFGGNGPLHACRVARSAGIEHIVVPPSPSVGSALGFLYAPVSFEIVRSHYTFLDAMDIDIINHLFEQMISQAREVVTQGSRESTINAKPEIRRTAYMRYSGQGHEIEILLPDRPITTEDLAPLTNEFEKQYSIQFSRPVPGMDIEILNWAVSLATRAIPCPPTLPEPLSNKLMVEKTTQITCDLDGVLKDAALIARNNVKPGDQISGPALIVEPQTTTLVSADFSARMDAVGNLVLTQNNPGRI